MNSGRFPKISELEAALCLSATRLGRRILEELFFLGGSRVEKAFWGFFRANFLESFAAISSCDVTFPNFSIASKPSLDL